MEGLAMDTIQATYAMTPPALDPFGGPHFARGDEPAERPVTWTGDPSSVPLPTVAEENQSLDGTELDGIIFAALIAG
jgi:hypothetical protein